MALLVYGNYVAIATEAYEQRQQKQFVLHV